MFHDILFLVNSHVVMCARVDKRICSKNIMQPIIKIYTSVVSFPDTQAVSAAKRLGAHFVATVLIII